jgi:hypothetical protein
MKKIVTLAVLITWSFTLFACSAQPNGINGQGQNAAAEQTASPFTLEFGYSENEINSFTSNDSLRTIAGGGPFYAGSENYVQAGLQQFRQAKIAFVDMVMKEVDQSVMDSLAYSADLKNLKNKYLDYLSAVLDQNKKLAAGFKDMADYILEPEVGYMADFALYNSIDAGSSNEAVNAMMKYQKTYLAIQSVNLLTQDTTRTVAGLLTLEDALQNSSDAQLKKIAGDMENEVPGMVDALGSKLAALQQGSENVNMMLKQINSSEYYMGLASVQFMDDTLKILQPSIDALTPKGPFTADDVAAIKELAKQYGGFSAQIRGQLNNVDKKELAVLTSEQNSIVPLAYADAEGYGQKALGFLKSAGQATVAAGKLGWQAAKTTLKTARTAAGLTLDTIGAETKSVFDVGFGLANGNSVKEIASEVGNNFVQVGKNWEQGKSGSKILGTAKDYFDGAEKAGGALLEGGVEKVVGKGWTSYLAGHAGNLTVNLFTAFGKGITKVANPESSSGEIAEGALDIGLSFIGGSKVLASGSQIAKGSKDVIKLFGEGGINLLEHAVSNSELKDLKAITADILKNTKLTPGEVEKLISNSIEVEAEEAIQKELIQASSKIDEEFVKLLKNGASTSYKNGTEVSVKAYREFVEKSFETSLSGVKDAIKTVLGEDAKSYLDNLFANKFDDLIKGIVKDHIGKELIPGIKIIPDLKDLAGKWDQGTMVITDVIASDEFKAEAKKEGCDISDIEAQKGKNQALGLSLAPTGDNGGNMTFKMSDGKSQSIPFTYKDGVISATYTDQGATMTMNLKVDEANGAYKISGPMDINYKNNSLQIKADAGASKAVPKAAAGVAPAPAPAAPTPASATSPAPVSGPPV